MLFGGPDQDSAKDVYNRTPPPKGTPPRFRTLLGLIKPCIVLTSSLNPGVGVPLVGYYCGTIVIP